MKEENKSPAPTKPPSQDPAPSSTDDAPKDGESKPEAMDTSDPTPQPPPITEIKKENVETEGTTGTEEGEKKEGEKEEGAGEKMDASGDATEKKEGKSSFIEI